MIWVIMFSYGSSLQLSASTWQLEQPVLQVLPSFHRSNSCSPSPASFLWLTMQGRRQQGRCSCLPPLWFGMHCTVQVPEDLQLASSKTSRRPRLARVSYLVLHIVLGEQHHCVAHIWPLCWLLLAACDNRWDDKAAVGPHVQLLSAWLHGVCW